MYISYTPEQEQLRQQLREYFAALMTPDRRAGLAHADGEYGDGATYKEIVRQLGRDGWLAIGYELPSTPAILAATTAKGAGR